MGNRGPKKQPGQKLQLYRGPDDRQARRRREPGDAAGIARCPSWLTPAAKNKWRTLAPRLREAGRLSILEGDALARYCQTWARWRECEEFLATYGATYPVYALDREGQPVSDPSGSRVIRRFAVHPQALLATQLAAILAKLETAFGLTPAARAALRSDENPAADDLETRYFG